MSVTIANIIIGAGNIFIADSTDASFETASQATLFSTYHIGATMDGVELRYEPDYIDIVVDQLKDAAKIFNNGFKVTVATNMAEATLYNLRTAWDMANAQLSPNTSNPTGTQNLYIGIAPDTVTERQLIVLGKNQAGAERRYYARRAIAVEASNHALKRAEATVFPVAFRLLADPSFSSPSYEYGYIKDSSLA